MKLWKMVQVGYNWLMYHKRILRYQNCICQKLPVGFQESHLVLQKFKFQKFNSKKWMQKKIPEFLMCCKIKPSVQMSVKRSRYVLQNQIAVISNRSEDDQGWFSCVSSSSLCYRCRLKFLWLLLRTVAWTWLSWLEIKNAVLHLTKFIILCSKKSLN